MARHAMATAPLSNYLDHTDLGIEQAPDYRFELCYTDGYMTAVVLSPVHIPASEWTNAIVDEAVATEEEAALLPEARAYLRRSVEDIRQMIRGAPRDYAPMYMDFDVDIDLFNELAAIWAEGFQAGVRLRSHLWKPVYDDRQARPYLLPLVLLPLDDDELRRILGSWEREISDLRETRSSLADAVPESVVWFYRHWHGKRHPSGGSEPGRNDPCPCGSGKKYKKCCLA